MTRIIVPIKRFDSAKQRLVGHFSPARRYRLAEAMAETILVELSKVGGLDEVFIATSEPGIASMVRRFGFELIPDPGSAGLNDAIANALEHVVSTGNEDVGIVFSDLPLFTAAEFEKVLTRHRGGSGGKMTIVTDRRNDGTNVLLCRPARCVKPVYGEGSADRYRSEAAKAGLAFDSVIDASLSLDLDGTEDIAALSSIATKSRNTSSNSVLQLLGAWAAAGEPSGDMRCA
jgi:2-phospho-L-lactate guanylyltransferase